LTHTALTWIRWTTWVTLGVGILIFLQPQDLNVSCLLIEAICASIGVLDASNLRRNQLEMSTDIKKCLSYRGWLLDLVKFVTLLLLAYYLALCEFVISWRFIHYYCFVAFTFLTAKIVELVLTSCVGDQKIVKKRVT